MEAAATQVTLFQRYMAVRFIKPFIFGLGVFSLLIFLGDLFDKMQVLLKSNASLWVILQWLWLDVPYWAVRIIPMATLLATLFSVTGFIRSGEWIAVQASGFNPKRFLQPMIVIAVLITGLSFTAQETVLPVCYRRAQFLWREYIHPEWEWDQFKDAMLVGGPGLFITAKLFQVKEGAMDWPVLDHYVDGRIEKQIVAKKAVWEADRRRWIFKDGAERILNADGTVSQEKEFVEFDAGIDRSPKSMIPRTKNPDEMSLAETAAYLRQVRILGGSSREAWTVLYAKLAYPFSNLILCALGIPLALRLRRFGKIVSFGSALALSFLYLWFMEMGRAVGMTGRAPAFLAAWAPNFIFGLTAYWAQMRSEL